MITSDSDMTSHRVRINLLPARDQAFRAAFLRAVAGASFAEVDVDMPESARLVEDRLRVDGYPNADIRLYRTVDEYRDHVANWVVRRDGRAR